MGMVRYYDGVNSPKTKKNIYDLWKKRVSNIGREKKLRKINHREYFVELNIEVLNISKTDSIFEC